MKKIIIVILVLSITALMGCRKKEVNNDFIKNSGKVAYLIPGFGEKVTDNVYQKLSQSFSDKGIEPRIIEVFNEEGIEKYTEDILARIHSYPDSSSDETYLFGISIGAVGAFNIISVIRPKVAIIASPAIFFEENRVEAKAMAWHSKEFVMSMMVHDDDVALPKLSQVIDDINKKSPSTKIIVMSGSKDMEMVKSNAIIISDSIRGATYQLVSNAGDRLADKAYLEAVLGLVESL